MMKKAVITRVVKIFVDLRENEEFVKKLTKATDESTIVLEKTTLPVGDIIFKYGDKDVILIERKTLDDLNKSITDGRYKEQKIRIIDSEIVKKYYLIEGILCDNGFGKINKIPLKDHSKIYGAIVNTTLRDNIEIIRTENMDDSVSILFKMYNCLQQFGDQIIKNPVEQTKIVQTASDYVQTLKPAKKDNMTKEVCYLTQLTQIPGVSVTIGQRIVEEYPSFKTLFDRYNLCQTENERKKLLMDLVLPNGRKIGPVVSERVSQFLF